jgi:hypothetical protein
MTTRELPPEEWAKLAGTEAESVWPHLNPETAHVIVVEQGPQIVGCWIALPIYHVECLWIDPAHRKASSVGRRLWTGMRRLLGGLSVTNVLTAAMSEDVRALLAHVGAEQLPGDHYVMRFPQRTEPCQQQS